MTSTTRRQLPVRLSPRPVRALTSRVLASQAASDLRAWGFIPWGCVLVLTLAFLVGFLSGGWVLTWHGFEYISPEAVLPTVGNCGDYCGTDAGLLP